MVDYELCKDSNNSTFYNMYKYTDPFAKKRICLRKDSSMAYGNTKY